MRKVLVFAILSLFMAGSISAQPKNSDKALWKSAKKMAKEFASDGWKVDGSRTLEELIFIHRQKLLNEDNQELVGNVIGNTSARTVNQGQQWAATNASILYAKKAKQMVAGRITAEIGAQANQTSSVDSFYDAYESRVIKEINGELKKSFSLYREKKDGGIDYKAFYIVNEESASNARIRAMELALKESEFSRLNAERISEFVREAFTIELE